MPLTVASSPFCDEVHLIRAHRGQLATARAVRRLLEGSEADPGRPKRHVQDPYSFRCMPQVHGATKDTIDYVEGVLETEINSPTDNPTVFPEEDMIISAGNFHGQPIALAMDFLAIALAELGNISERRIYKLISGARSCRSSWWRTRVEQRLHDPAVSRGVDRQPVEGPLHARLGRFDSLVAGAGGPCQHGLERRDEAPPCGAQHRAGAGHRAFNAAQALEFRRPARTSPELELLVADYRKRVPFIDNDTVMYPPYRGVGAIPA